MDYDKGERNEDNVEFEHLLKKHTDSKQPRRGPSDYDMHPMETVPPMHFNPHYYPYANNWFPNDPLPCREETTRLCPFA